MSKTISLNGGLKSQEIAGDQTKETGVKAAYLKTTQSHKKGDVIDYDEGLLNHRQLKEKGFLEIMDKETKVTGPEETKVTGPEETKVTGPEETKKTKKTKKQSDRK